MNRISNICKISCWLPAVIGLSLAAAGTTCAQDNSFNPPSFNPPQQANTEIIQDNFLQRAEYREPELSVPKPASDLETFKNSFLAAPDEAVAELANSNPQWWGGIKSQAASLDLPKVFGSLAIVLGGYFALVWFSRSMTGESGGGLPREVVEVLGQTPFGPKNNLQLVRLGSKLLLLLNSQEGTQTIGEITDQQEVNYLIGICGGKRNARSNTPTAAKTASPVEANPSADLRRILNQLQNATDGMKSNSIFEA